MRYHNGIRCWLFLLLFSIPFLSCAAITPKAMVVFGDSLSDVGNTTYLLKTLRQEENSAYIVAPFKKFVITRMTDFANDYYVPQMVLDAGIIVVTNFFDNDLAPYLVNLIAQVRLVPLLPGQPYWNSRFSNGRVWNEYLAEALFANPDESVYMNRAFAGSWAATYDYQLTVWNLIRHPLGIIKALVVGKLIPPSLGLTVQAYLLEFPDLDEETVYFVYSGGNDYLNALQFEDKYDYEVMSAYVENVLDGITSAVLNLHRAGARRFVVLAVPFVGDSPKFAKSSDREVLNLASEEHNKRLIARVENWKQYYPDTDFLFVNTQDFLTKAMLEPEKYGLTNVSEPCIDVKLPMYHAFSRSPFANNYVLRQAQVLQYKDESFALGEANYHVCSTPESYLFWDEVHPSTRAHRFLAHEVCKAMKEHGYTVNCLKTVPDV